MNSKIFAILVLVTNLVISGCGVGQILGPTLTPLPTITPSPTATLIPTQTSTPIPTSSTYIPVPRWMILGQPGKGVEILGEKWKYTNDRWGETYGCIDYTRETSTHINFEQCFALVDGDKISFNSQHTKFLADNFEALKPNNTFSDIGQISLLGKRLVGNPQKTIEFFEIIGVEKYVLLVELYIETDKADPLQAIYESEISDIMDYVLQNSLQKSHLIPRPTATPLSPTQESFYTPLVANLITESEANVLYGSTWEVLGDDVSAKKDTAVCRSFEDRTNADVLWVGFENCIYSVKNLTFETIVDRYNEPNDVLLESNHKYNDKFVLYGYDYGHTFFYAILLHGEFVYIVYLESRTLSGQTVKEVFTKDVDDFIYGVLMINAER